MFMWWGPKRRGGEEKIKTQREKGTSLGLFPPSPLY